MQKILFESVAAIKSVLSEIGVKRFLLVAGKSYEFSGAKEYLDEVDAECIRFSDFSANPVYEDVVKGVTVFLEKKCDAIVAVGGGSAIDVAKCIKLFSVMDRSKNFLLQDYKETDTPLIAVPTTAGTGSESTGFAVIYYNGVKQSVSSEKAIPDYAILDENLLKSLPIYQKKCAFFDALCQAIESWWSINSDDESKEYSKQAIELLSENAYSYINEDSAEVNAKILYAANLAGRAINITRTTAPHAMSYKLTSIYGIPHGHSVVLCLLPVWRKMLESRECCDERGYGYLKNVFTDISYALECSSADEAILKIDKMRTDFGLQNPISTTKAEHINTLVGSVNIERLSNNPVKFNQKDLKEMYERIVLNEA